MAFESPRVIGGLQTFPDMACTVCGCVCDDLQLTTSGGQLVRAERACPLAQPWFERLGKVTVAQAPLATVRGQSVETASALSEAAKLLRGSAAPLIWGLARSSTSGQRAAGRLAERLRANIDTTASVCHGPSIMAIQQVGESTCTLGEVRHRADLVIFWGANPVETHPRHLERYSLDPVGEFLPGGRSDRTLIVIDHQATPTSALADEFYQLPVDRDFEVIWALRTLLKGLPLPPTFEPPLPLEKLQALVERLKGCRYGVVFFGLGLARRGIGHANVEGLLRLVRELNAFTRFTARRLRIPGDVSGADAVLCWQTGFPFAVSLAHDVPRYNPGEYSANELLERGEVDACVLVGSEPVRDLSPAAQRTLQRIPTIVLDYPHVDSAVEPTVRFTTAVYGIHAAGTAYRMDEVPIPLRAILPCPWPTDEQILDRLREAL